MEKQIGYVALSAAVKLVIVRNVQKYDVKSF